MDPEGKKFDVSPDYTVTNSRLVLATYATVKTGFQTRGEYNPLERRRHNEQKTVLHMLCLAKSIRIEGRRGATMKHPPDCGLNAFI
ncbi:hypothetical protein DOY81_015119 [Sarcophaga bullata]|nr:hypothetical protein DOY81_015119 [Sarcophaga bullata]